MIIQALARYYDILAADPECPIARQGYSTVPVSFSLALSPDGELRGLVPLVQTQQRGKKMIEVSRRMVVPERVVRTVGVKANFLCDTAAYVLGISEKDDVAPQYSAARFAAFCELHFNLLDGVDCPEAYAVLRFLQTHDPRLARDHPLISTHMDDLLKAANLVFRLDGEDRFVHETPLLRRVWESHREANSAAEMGQCLATGEYTAIARLHPALKGVRDAQSSGASLVGFNAPAYESYNRAKGQGWNAPTGERAVFAYTTALNYLLSRESHLPKLSIGDTTVVYWAESPDKTYTDLFSTLFNPDWLTQLSDEPQRDTEAEDLLREMADKIKRGAALDAEQLVANLDENVRFFVLGLAPNAARISVRFFHSDPFIKIVERILKHYQDLKIQREFENQPANIPLYVILGETISKKAKDKESSPLMSGALMRAILMGTPYPAAVYSAILTRIRVDADDPQNHIRRVNYPRAALIKAYLTRKYRTKPESSVQEVLCMALNEQSTYPAYLLGRLFAVLEKAQAEAQGDLNAPIKDRFFSSSCASPITAFPRLLRLSQHHLAKLETPRKIYFERLIGAIMNSLQVDPRPFPAHLSLDDQGVFVLGYYHQRTAFFVSTKPAQAAANHQPVTEIE